MTLDHDIPATTTTTTTDTNDKKGNSSVANEGDIPTWGRLLHDPDRVFEQNAW